MASVEQALSLGSDHRFGGATQPYSPNLAEVQAATSGLDAARRRRCTTRESFAARTRDRCRLVDDGSFIDTVCRVRRPTPSRSVDDRSRTHCRRHYRASHVNGHLFHGHAASGRRRVIPTPCWRARRGLEPSQEGPTVRLAESNAALPSSPKRRRPPRRHRQHRPSACSLFGVLLPRDSRACPRLDNAGYSCGNAPSSFAAILDSPPSPTSDGWSAMSRPGPVFDPKSIAQ